MSAGDLLREERAREGSEFGQLIANYIKEGKIVPVEITINLLRKVYAPNTSFMFVSASKETNPDFFLQESETTEKTENNTGHLRHTGLKLDDCKMLKYNLNVQL